MPTASSQEQQCRAGVTWDPGQCLPSHSSHQCLLSFPGGQHCTHGGRVQSCAKTTEISPKIFDTTSPSFAEIISIKSEILFMIMWLLNSSLFQFVSENSSHVKVFPGHYKGARAGQYLKKKIRIPFKTFSSLSDSFLTALFLNRSEFMEYMSLIWIKPHQRNFFPRISDNQLSISLNNTPNQTSASTQYVTIISLIYLWYRITKSIRLEKTSEIIKFNLWLNRWKKIQELDCQQKNLVKHFFHLKKYFWN